MGAFRPRGGLIGLVLPAAIAVGVWLSPFRVASAEVYTFVDEDGVIHVTNVSRGATARGASDRAAGQSTATKSPLVETSVTARSLRYVRLVDEAAREHQIDSALIHAVIRAESSYNAAAVSPKGAIGLMQLMPATARRYGVDDPRDATQNIRGGVRYLRDLLDMYHYNLALALAAYNAGEAAVARHGGVPPYAETTAYVARVLDFYLRRPSYMRTASTGRAHGRALAR